MDFFRAQDEARSKTARLIFLFVAALLGMIAALYLLVVLIDALDRGHIGAAWDPELLSGIALGVTLLVGSGSLYKSIALSVGGGVSVAESLGGRRVSRQTQDANERRLLNVVDEMALASGMVAPQVFVLDNEQGINAFAAGTDVNKAVVAVTRGTLEQLTRDELQGVVAHEFSHIFNGDMRLNIRLIGVLHGILLIAMLGRGILEGSSRRTVRSDKKDDGGFIIFLLGFGVLLIGYIGVFFGQLIKAAVSRQREYLADASAVQFTRNPLGLAGALKKIAKGVASSRISHPKAESMSHMFFGEGVGHLSQRLASHPPIHERIQRLDPSYIPETPMPAAASIQEPEGGAQHPADDTDQAQISPQDVSMRVGKISPEDIDSAARFTLYFSETMVADLHAPSRVEGLLYGMLVAEVDDPMPLFSDLSIPSGTDITARALAHAAWFKTVTSTTKLSAIELAIPALLESSPAERARVQENIQRLVRADGQVGLFEFALTTMLRNGLSTAHSNEQATTGNYDLPAIRRDVADLLAMLAHVGHADQAAASAAFAQAAQQAPIDQLGAFPSATIQLDLDHLDGLLGRLRSLTFVFRGQLIEACVAAISSDGRVTRKEAEMLRAIGACLDCPVPPLLPGPDS